jgi:exodeoxyribonuclease V alpha subunit
MQTLIKQIKGALAKGYDLYKDIQVLVPVYKGDLGIDQVNLLLQDEFNPKTSLSMKYGDKSFYEGDKVIQLVNEPKQGIMNGDVGIVKKVHKNEDNQYTLTVIFDDQEVVYNKDDIDQLNLAYAISVHKAQGSEYDIVMMPLVKSYMHMFKKELIYTAMTRAKSHLLLLGDMKLLMYAANHVTEKRQTLLKQFLNQDVSKEEKPLSPYDFM